MPAVTLESQKPLKELLESGGKPEYQVGPRSDCRPDEMDMV